MPVYKKMKILHCCPSLQYEVLILSFIDGVGALVLLGLFIHAFLPALIDITRTEFDLDFILTFVFSVGALIIQLALACVLFYGAKQDKRRPCRIWLCVSTLLLILKMIIVIVHLATGNHDIISYGLIFDSVYKLYQGIIVAAFMIRELNEDGGGSVILHKKCSMRQFHL